MVNGIHSDELKYIYFVNAISSGASVLGCLFIIVMYTLFEDLRKFAFKLIMILSVFDLINAISFLIPTYDSDSNSIVCLIQGVLMNLSTLCALIWIFIVAYVYYAIIVKGNIRLENFLNRFIVIDVIGSVIITLCCNVATWNNFGYCWIYKGNTSGLNSLKYVLILFPLWLIMILNSVLYFRVYKNLKSTRGNKSEMDSRRDLSKKIRIYPIIMMICYLPFTVKTCLQIAYGSEFDSFAFGSTIVSEFIRCLIGLFNALAYGFNRKVRIRVKEIFIRGSRKSYSIGLNEVSK